jgi:hypothetical protein
MKGAADIEVGYLGFIHNQGFSTSVSEVSLFNVQSGGILNFGTNNTERMRITSAGNVGIGTGTSSPTRLLDVNGAMRLRAIAAPTTDLNAGDMYYDSATNRMRFRRTSDWVEMGMLWDTVEW